MLESFPENESRDLSEVLSASRPRLGILTFHKCINYGSYWQARCLAEYLQSLNLDAFLIDHCSGEVNRAEWRVALRPTLPTRVRPQDVPRYQAKTRKFFDEFESLPTSDPVDLHRLEEIGCLDCLVIGSDEVWNLRHPWYAGLPLFFGEGIEADRKIAYAASFGNYSCWEGLGSPYTDFLSRLDAISVRDENSWWMLKNSLEREVPYVLDPCLLSPPKCALKDLPYENFILVYGHNFSPEFAASARNWARENGKLLVSIGYYNDGADEQWIEAGPQEFASAFAQADAVVTNFFHGCVFSLLNEKPFGCEITPYRSIKVRGLMELLGAESHLVLGGGGDGELSCLLTEPPRPKLMSRISELRRSSKVFLSDSLGVKRPCAA